MLQDPYFTKVKMQVEYSKTATIIVDPFSNS